MNIMLLSKKAQRMLIEKAKVLGATTIITERDVAHTRRALAELSAQALDYLS